MINVCCIVGRLTKDVDLRYTTGAEPKAVARFTVAVDDGFGDNKRTNFIPVVAWQKTAENCEKFLHKGSQVAITGKIQTGSYEKDGRTVYTTDIIAREVCFVGGNSKTAENENQKPEQADIPQGFMAVDDNDIPF